MITNQKIIGRVALKGFFNITEEWSLDPGDQKILLGGIPDHDFEIYKELDDVELPDDILDRISCILGIYKALRILFTKSEQANEWVKKDNTAFNDESALRHMLKGKVSNLDDVLRYLNTQI